MIIFVAGTDTGVGKTFVAAQWLRQFPNYSYWKPIQTGPEDDTLTARQISGADPSRMLPNAYALPEPLSPHLAAERAGVTIEVSRLKLPHCENLVVEGAGGLLVPLTTGFRQIDLVQQWGVPVLLVAHDRLGAINHTLLSVEACRNRGIRILGIVLNRGKEDVGNAPTLRRETDLPVYLIPEVSSFICATTDFSSFL